MFTPYIGDIAVGVSGVAFVKVRGKFDVSLHIGVLRLNRTE